MPASPLLSSIMDPGLSLERTAQAAQVRPALCAFTLCAFATYRLYYKVAEHSTPWRPDQIPWFHPVMGLISSSGTLTA